VKLRRSLYPSDDRLFLAIVAYIFGVWLFVFSVQFRAMVLERWRSRHGISHVLSALEATISLACTGLPVGLLLVPFSL